MRVIQTEISGVTVIEPKVWGDDRGYFYESYAKTRYAEAGISHEFVQDNVSFSRLGVLRGMHVQNPKSQGKLVSVLAGSVYDVAVDVRRGSPTFGKFFGMELSAENKKQLWVGPGLAHGFLVTSETAVFCYKCTEFYSPENEFSVAWNDPDLGISWPLETLKHSGDITGVELSAKDKVAPRLRDIDSARLPIYREVNNFGIGL